MIGEESSTPGTSSANPSVFATTHWSVVLAAGQEDSTLASAALDKLCRTYWYPLYAYLRRRGYKEPDAQDLIQGFFLLLFKRQAFQNVEAGRAKFRSYLLTALKHFLIDEHQRQQAKKRGGGQVLISLDGQEAEQRYRLEPQDGQTPETLYEHRWATTLIDRAMARLQQDFAAEDKSALFEALRGFIVERADHRSYADVARQLGLNEEAVKKTVQRLRNRYRKIVREEVAQTVSTTSEIDEELRYLVSVLAS